MLNSVLVHEKKYSFSASVCPQAHVPVLPWLLLNISWPSCCPVFRPPRFGLIYFDTRVTGNTAAVNQVTTLCQYNPVHVCIQHDPDPGSRHLRLVWTVRCVAARSPSSPITRSIVSNVTEAAGNSPRWRLHIFFLLIIVVSLHENAAWPRGLIWADNVLTQFYRRRRSCPSLSKWSKDAVMYYTRTIGMLSTM